MKRDIPKRAERAKTQKNNLVYKRTEIDNPRDFNFNKVFYSLAGVFVVGILYLMFPSGAFTVQNVKVEGTREIDPAVLRDMATKRMQNEIFKGNMFLFDTDAFTSDIKKDFSLKSLHISKEYPKQITIKVDEYQSELQWSSGGKYYLIDERGRAAAVMDRQRNNLAVVVDKKNLPVEIGKSLVTTDFINFIKYINQNFSQATHGQITKLEINENFNEVNVYTNLGYYIVFDTTRDPRQELNNLATALASPEIRAKRKLTYLDMRIKNKVFYQ